MLKGRGLIEKRGILWRSSFHGNWDSDRSISRTCATRELIGVVRGKRVVSREGVDERVVVALCRFRLTKGSNAHKGSLVVMSEDKQYKRKAVPWGDGRRGEILHSRDSLIEVEGVGDRRLRGRGSGFAKR